jgi:hypothetical protein
MFGQPNRLAKSECEEVKHEPVFDLEEIERAYGQELKECEGYYTVKMKFAVKSVREFVQKLQKNRL